MWRSPEVILVSRMPDPEEVRQEHLLALQRMHLALGTPVPQHAHCEQDSCTHKAKTEYLQCFTTSGMHPEYRMQLTAPVRSAAKANLLACTARCHWRPRYCALHDLLHNDSGTSLQHSEELYT